MLLSPEPQPSTPQPHFRRYAILCGLAVPLLVIANSAIWFNNYIFNTENFTELTTQAILNDSSRDAIAGVVVDRALEQRPAVRGAIQQPATKLISGLLDSNLAHTIFERSVTRLQTAITSKNPQPVTLDLSSIKETATKVIDVAGAVSGRSPDDSRIDPADIPDSVTLVDTSKLPNIYRMGVVLLWLGPLAVLATIIAFGYVLYRVRDSLYRLQQFLAIQGASILGAWLVALLLGPLFKPALLGQVPDANLRIVVESVYDAFMAAFTNQAGVLLVLGLLWLLAAGGIWHYRTQPRSGRTAAEPA
jgi:hypothetical protein